MAAAYALALRISTPKARASFIARLPQAESADRRPIAALDHRERGSRRSASAGVFCLFQRVAIRYVAGMSTTLPRTRSCFVCGAANPFGLNLEFTAADGWVTARYRPRREHSGFQDTVHGGLISTVLDEAMVWGIGAALGRFAYCAELTVRFLKPVQPGVDYLVMGRLVDNRKDRLLLAEAELRDAGQTVRAKAAGKYIPIPQAEMDAMLADFPVDPRPMLAEVASRPGFRLQASSGPGA